MSANSEAMKQWRKRNPNYMHNWYMGNREILIHYGRKWRLEHPNYHSQYSKEYYEANSEPIKTSVVEWQKNNPEKVVAQNALKIQIRSGNIVRPDSCSVCGKICITEGHHDDYKKPLEVKWLCHSCHKRVHARTLSLVH